VSALLDAAALVALIRDEPAAADVEAALRAGEASILSVNLAEVLYVLVRRGGFAEPDVRRLLGRLDDVLVVRPVDASIALRGGSIRARRYHRTKAAISLADCLCLGAAGPDDRVLSLDAALLRVAKAEGIAIEALPDSQGRRPRV
jgi:ribonuclease VapC